LLDRESIRVEDRQSDNREVKPITGRPNHGRDRGSREIELRELRGGKSVAQRWQCLFRRSYSGRRHIGVDGLGEVCLVLVGRGQIPMEIGRELDAVAGDAVEMAEHNHPVASELMQIEGVAAARARNVRLAGEFRAPRRQLSTVRS